MLILNIVSGCDATTNYIYKNDNFEQFMDVTYDEIKDMINQDQSFIVYIARDDCFDCSEFKPYLLAYLDENPGVYVYNFDVKSLYHGDESVYSDVKLLLQYDWTPSLRFIYEGEINSKYQYLDDDFYKIDSTSQRVAAQKQFRDEFIQWMDKYYK